MQKVKVTWFDPVLVFSSVNISVRLGVCIFRAWTVNSSALVDVSLHTVQCTVFRFWALVLDFLQRLSISCLNNIARLWVRLFRSTSARLVVCLSRERIRVCTLGLSISCMCTSVRLGVCQCSSVWLFVCTVKKFWIIINLGVYLRRLLSVKVFC